MFVRCAAICRPSVAAAGLAIAALGLSTAPAGAWHRHHHHHYWPTVYHSTHHHVRPGASRAADIAAIVVDANSGRVLYARSENDARHPASITKVMTLYLLFEQLEKGRLRLDSRLTISANAAAQAPTKLDLDPGETISVDDAIKAVVTKSANDIAVAIAEAIGGDEETFCAMMTRKAHALGMNATRFVNASGLPDDEQITTAHDLAILGRAVQERFPRYYHYFSTQVFYFNGVANPNHNHLLGRVEGMDGIKTGYTRSSGFNLLTSVRRDGRHIIAVVLGGASAASRDHIMADLIESEIDKGAVSHTAAMIAENDTGGSRSDVAEVKEMPPPRPPVEPKSAPEPRQAAEAPPLVPPAPAPRPASAALPVPEPRPTADVTPVVDLHPVAKPLQLSGATPDPVQVASIADQPTPRPRPAFVAATPKAGEDQRVDASDGRRSALDGSTARTTTMSATPSSLRWVVGAPPARDRQENPKAENPKAENPKAENLKAENTKVAKAEPPRAEPVAADPPPRPAAARSGWMIQIGATDDVVKANELLARAKAEGRATLGNAQPFTEKVQKGSETLYRARFAGLEENQAEIACRILKRSGFACFATKN